MNKDIALVTGASKGLGLAWARRLAKDGYRVLLTARTLKQAETATLPLLNEGLEVCPMKLDISNTRDIQKLKKTIADNFGRLDLLINNAGINSGTRAKGDKALQAKNLHIEELDASELLSMVEVNAIAPILLAQELRPILTKSDHPKVINIGSWLGSVSLKSNGGNYSYAVSKSALNMMNRAFAFDVLQDNIISVVVNPGWVQTDMGGMRAKFTADESVNNLLTHVVDKISSEQAGQFLNYDGSVHPW